ncbi:MAG: hypothetical protein QNK03_03050 [Myxococcota bacterium]|nr:hypothetical protein [Myxococcota bacterium]
MRNNHVQPAWLLALALGLAIAAGPAAAQTLQLNSASPTITGADAGHYFVADAAIDLSLSIVVSVATSAERLGFRSELALVGLDGVGGTTCVDLASLPNECVLPLQRIEFTRSEVAVQGQLAFPKQVQVPLSAPGADGFDAFVADQVLAGRSLQLRLVLDTDDVYPVDPGTVAVGGPVELFPLSGRLFFGNVETTLLSLSRGGDCPSADGWRTSFASVEWQPGGSEAWQTVSLSLFGQDCVEPIAGDSALDLRLSAGEGIVPSAPGQLGGLDVSLIDVTLLPDGVVPNELEVELHPTTSFHIQSVATGLPLPRGRTQVSFFGALTPASGDFDDVDIQIAGFSGYLRAEGLPFSFLVDSVGVDGSGLKARVIGTHYHYDLPYASGDPRGTRGPRSNDARFRRGGVPVNDALRVDDTGLHATGVFLAASADTHFPRTDMRFGSFAAEVVGSALRPHQRLPLLNDRYRFDQLPYCPGCPDAGPVPSFTVPIAQDQALGADGAVLGRSDAVGGEAAWGPRDQADTARIFERTADAGRPGVMYLPGFRALGTAESENVPEYLLGMRAKLVVDGLFAPGTHHPLPDPQSRAGNHFMAGLTMGPELLISEIGVPAVGDGSSLENLPTRIGFGGIVNPDFENVIGSLATKYVAREGGVTFVLNTLTPPQPTVYGHLLELRRFAVRGVVNELDPETWIDGTVMVPAPGDFDVSLSSIELECDGDVGGGRLDAEFCGDESDNNGNGLADENCNERLLAWRTPLDVRQAEFRPVVGGAGACFAEGRDFYVLGRIQPRAFDQSMMLGAFWDPDGMPYQAHIEGSTNRTLDRPDIFSGSSDYVGFDVAIDEEVELGLSADEQSGWFRLEGLVGVPFWDDIPIDLRIQNRTEDEPEQTLVYGAGTLDTVPGQATADNADGFLINQMRELESTHARAHFDWASTEFAIDLPVYYEADRHDQDQPPQFTGIPEDINLSVFDASARVNYVTPVETRLGFGATANFQPLSDQAGDVATFLDLNQPECAGATPVDAFLNEFFFVSLDEEGNGPVKALCEQIIEAQYMLRCWSGGGLEDCIEDALTDQVTDAVEDPAQVAADLNRARVDAIWQVMNARLEIQTLIDDHTDPSNYANEDALMVGVYNGFPGMMPPLDQGVPELIKLQQAFPAALSQADFDNQILPTLAQARAGLTAADDGLRLAGDALPGLRTQIKNDAEELAEDITRAVGEIDAARAEIEAAGLQFCSESNGLLAPIREARDQMTALTGKFGSLTSTLRIVFELFEFDGKKVEQALEAFIRYGDDVTATTDEAIEAIAPILVCDDPEAPDQADLQAMLDAVTGRIQAIADALNALNPAMDQFVNRLLVDTDLVAPDDGGWVGEGGVIETQIEDARDVTQALEGLVDDLQNEALRVRNSYPGPDAWPNAQYAVTDADGIRALWNQRVVQATDPPGKYQWYYPATNTSVVFALTSDLTSSLQAVQQAITDAAQADLVPVLNLVPFFSSGEELVAWVVDLVLGLPAAEDLITRAHEELDEPVGAMVDLVVHMLDNIEALMRHAIGALGTYEDNFFKLTDSGRLRLSRLGRFDELTGYAMFHGDDLERLHMVARFDFLHEMFDNLIETGVAIDVERWSSDNEVSASCMRNVPVRQLLDISVRTEGYFGGDGANILGSPIGLDSFFIKRIRQSGREIASAGGFGVLGDLPLYVPLVGFLTLHDLRATWGNTKVLRFCEASPDQICFHDRDCAGADTCSPAPLEPRGTCNHDNNLGCAEDIDCCGDNQECIDDFDAENPSRWCRKDPTDNEDYAGARVKASVTGSQLPVEVGMFVGRTCSREPIEYLDAQAAEFISFPDGRFRGTYLRGGATIPVIPGPCILELDVGADVGMWSTYSELKPKQVETVGGLVSGHASGKVGCLMGLRGQVTVAAEFGEGAVLGGEGFGVAGVGFDCDPQTWTSVQRSRNDKWCATVDGRALIVLKNARWERGSLDISGPH